MPEGDGFRRYIGGGRFQGVAGLLDYCPEGFPPPTPSGGEGGGRPMFQWLPCGDEPDADAMTTNRRSDPSTDLRQEPDGHQG